MSAGLDSIRYLHVPKEILFLNPKKLSFDLPTVEHVIFEYIAINQMLAFVHHMPNLRRLKTHLHREWKAIDTLDFTIRKLNHLNVTIKDDWSFEELEQLFTICPHLTHFILQLDVGGRGRTMTEPREWQILFEQYLPDLICLRLRLTINFSDPEYMKLGFQAPFDHAEYCARDMRVRLKTYEHCFYRIITVFCLKINLYISK